MNATWPGVVVDPWPGPGVNSMWPGIAVDPMWPGGPGCGTNTMSALDTELDTARRIITRPIRLDVAELTESAGARGTSTGTRKFNVAEEVLDAKPEIKLVVTSVALAELELDAVPSPTLPTVCIAKLAALLLKESPSAS